MSKTGSCTVYNVQCTIACFSSTWEWKPEGLDLSAGPVPVFPVYNVYLDQRVADKAQGRLANLCSHATCVRLYRCAGFTRHSRKEVFLDLLGLRRAASGTSFCLHQKGGVPAAPSGTATLLRLSPNYQFRPRPILAVTDFRRPRLSWLDGRCVQGPGTYSPRHG